MKPKMPIEEIPINTILKIIEKTDIEIRAIYEKIYKSLENDDSRIILLMNFHETNLNTIILYTSLAENYSNLHCKEWWNERIPHQKDIINNETDFNFFVNDRETSSFNYLKDNYLLNIFFEFESRIRNIIRYIGIIPFTAKPHNSKKQFLNGSENWYDIQISFFNSYLGLQKQEYEVIEMFSLIRNSIHNGGFYFNPNYPNISICFNDKTHKFSNFDPINIITVDFLITLIEKFVLLIETVLLNGKISSIKNIVDLISNVDFENKVP